MIKTILWNIAQKYWPLATIVFVAIIILWGNLLPEYTLTLDMVFTPTSKFIINTANPASAPFDGVVFILKNFLPGWIVQKILLTSIFIFSGATMYLVAPVKNKEIKILCAIFYMSNPFIYTRFIAGHTHFLLAYSIFPLIIPYTIHFLYNPKVKSALKLSLLLTALSIFSTSHTYMAALYMLITGCTLLATKRIVINKNLIVSFLSLIVLSITLNFYWLFSFIKGVSPIDNFSSTDYELFKTATSSFDKLVNLIGLHGFWGEETAWGNGFIFAKNIIPFWNMFLAAMLCIVIYGAYNGLKRPSQRDITLTVLISGILALIFAHGPDASFLGKLNEQARNFIPFFKGFREPQKWSNILVLLYSILIAIGVETSINKYKKLPMKFITLIAIITLHLPIFFGFSGQLKPSTYPDSWKEINENLIANNHVKKILFLPWHMYMSFDFTHNRIIANPAKYYFAGDIIQGDNIELKNIFSLSQSPISKEIEKILFNHDQIYQLNTNPDLVADNLLKLDISHIILSKNLDYKNYLPLLTAPNFLVTTENDEMILYEVTNFSKQQ